MASWRPWLAAAILPVITSLMPPPSESAIGNSLAKAPGFQATPTLPEPGATLALPPTLALSLNAARPLDGGLEPVGRFRFGLGASERHRAIDCLAAAAIYEAGDDGPGQRAVIQVVLNRVRHPSYPKSVCGVVFQGSERRTGCQFTFTCDGSLRRVPGQAVWLRAQARAIAALDGETDPAVGSATHYHADYVLPVWSARLEKLAKIGAHIFYRFPGSWGRASMLKGGSSGEPTLPALAKYSGAHAAALDSSMATLPPPAQLATAHDASPVPSAAAALAPQSSAHLVAHAPSATAGRWALEAMNRCRGSRDCQVIAWTSTEQLESNRSRPASARDTPVFIYVKDAGSGLDLALWDCAVVPRSDPAQCLPANPAAIQRLMRQRG